MQLISLTEDGKAALAEAAAAERARYLKYERARRRLRVLGVFVPNLMGATIYAKLEAKGYTWDAGAEDWRKQPVKVSVAPFGPQEPPNDYRIYNRRRADGTFPPLSGFFDAVRDTAGEGEDTEAQKQTAAAR